MYAIIKSGGKQYRVEQDAVVLVDRLEGNAGDKVELGEVLLYSDGKDVKLGSPLVDGVKIAAEIVEQVRGDKIIVFKKKRRQNYRRKNGHRQEMTQLKILSLGGASKKAKKSETTAEQGAE